MGTKNYHAWASGVPEGWGGFFLLYSNKKQGKYMPLIFAKMTVLSS